jgi:hypothetical protein
VKNITVTVDEALYHQARIKAAERRTTVSALVRSYLEQLVAADSRFENLQREQADVIAAVRQAHPGFTAGNRLSRSEVHERRALP